MGDLPCDLVLSKQKVVDMRKSRWLAIAGMAALSAVLMFAVCVDDNEGGEEEPIVRTHTLTTNVGWGGGGSVTVNGVMSSGATTHNAGAEVTVQAVPAENYEFVNWSGAPAGVNATDAIVTFNISNNVTLTANFSLKIHSLTVTREPAAGGTVLVNGSVSQGSTTHNAGTEVTVRANPAQNYEFVNWSGAPAGVNATDAIVTFNINNNVTMTANFQATGGGDPVFYMVTVNNGSGGGNYEAGTTVSISAGEPPADHVFTNWTTTSAGVQFNDANSSTTTFIMPNNAVTVTANFQTSGGGDPVFYMVTITSAGTGATQSGEREVGATVEINAGEPPADHVFANWTTTSAGVQFANANSSTTTFTMPGNTVMVTANFTPTSSGVFRMVTITSPGTGATQSGEREVGTTVEVNAGTPPAGQRFLLWIGAPAGVNTTEPSISFIMPDNPVSLTAMFADIPPPVTLTTNVTPAGAGTVIPAGTTTHENGAVVQLVATANTGWKFSGWTNAGGNAETSVTMSTNLTVTAHFTEDTGGGGDEGQCMHPNSGLPVFCQWNAWQTNPASCHAINPLYATPAGQTCQALVNECNTHGALFTGVTTTGDNMTCNGTRAPLGGGGGGTGPEFCLWNEMGECWPIEAEGGQTAAQRRTACARDAWVFSNVPSSGQGAGGFCRGGTFVTGKDNNPPTSRPTGDDFCCQWNSGDAQCWTTVGDCVGARGGFRSWPGACTPNGTCPR